MSRNTTTGLLFEQQVSAQKQGIDLSKHKLYHFLNTMNIQWDSLLSSKLLPDEAYFDEATSTLAIYEKKFQKTTGSADEKLQTCAFKIQQFQKIARALNIEHVSYTYLLSSWFKKDKYKDVLTYIRSIPGCDYIIQEN